MSRDLLAQLERMVEERITKQTDPEQGSKPRVDEITFTRRDIREYTGWPNMRVVRYLKQLVDMELVVARTGRLGWRYVYSLEMRPAKPGSTGIVASANSYHLTTGLPAPYHPGNQA